MTSLTTCVYCCSHDYKGPVLLFPYKMRYIRVWGQMTIIVVQAGRRKRLHWPFRPDVCALEILMTLHDAIYDLTSKIPSRLPLPFNHSLASKHSVPSGPGIQTSDLLFTHRHFSTQRWCWWYICHQLDHANWMNLTHSDFLMWQQQGQRRSDVFLKCLLLNVSHFRTSQYLHFCHVKCSLLDCRKFSTAAFRHELNSGYFPETFQRSYWNVWNFSCQPLGKMSRNCQSKQENVHRIHADQMVDEFLNMWRMRNWKNINISKLKIGDKHVKDTAQTSTRFESFGR